MVVPYKAMKSVHSPKENTNAFGSRAWETRINTRQQYELGNRSHTGQLGPNKATLHEGDPPLQRGVNTKKYQIISIMIKNILYSFESH